MQLPSLFFRVISFTLSHPQDEKSNLSCLVFLSLFPPFLLQAFSSPNSSPPPPPYPDLTYLGKMCSWRGFWVSLLELKECTIADLHTRKGRRILALIKMQWVVTESLRTKSYGCGTKRRSSLGKVFEILICDMVFGGSLDTSTTLLHSMLIKMSWWMWLKQMKNKLIVV